jgi:two-component system phosphate regulon sensor histidine kinase PhoR
MRRKLMLSILGVLIVSVIVLTIFFVNIINNQYSESMKHRLENNNQFIISLFKSDNILKKDILFSDNLKKLQMRVTYIDPYGNVIFDTEASKESMNNHNDRAEIRNARENGVGYSLRYSYSINKYMLYVASSFNEGYIIRSSMPIDIIQSFELRFIKYFIIALICVILSAVIISSHLSQALVKPIKDLQYFTSRVANGDLYKRVKNITDDEIGELANAFNNMADKLQYSLKEVTDRQTRLEAILGSMDSGVIAIDKNYKVIMINPYAKDIFGINKDIIGCNLMDIIRDFELENIFKNTTEAYNEIKLLWPKERNLRVRTADIININELIGTVAVVQDITDIKRLENMRSQFVANVSHELKTPLTSIKGFAETLKYVEDTQKREKFLDIINDEADRLTRLINDVLTLSHIEQHIEMKFEQIDVNEIVEDVFNLMKNTADNKNIKLDIVSKNTLPLMGDSDRLKQMIINLVDNAIKYSDSGDSVIISTDMKDNNSIISVEDTGAGISKEHLNRIFERFYRIDKARSRAQGGTGLGLAIVKHIVLSFNGTINVDSEIGKGTKFIISIPSKE